jgi:hypothetical protein
MPEAVMRHDSEKEQQLEGLDERDAFLASSCLFCDTLVLKSV